jgi:hypothetical protein
MSNPFAALFEDIDRSSDPMLAEADFTVADEMFAPLAGPAPVPPPKKSVPSAPPAPSRAPASSRLSRPEKKGSPVHEMLSPPPSPRRKSLQQALVVTLGNEDQLMELNDLLASGWRVTNTAGFPTAEGGPGSLLVVAEQDSPR